MASKATTTSKIDTSSSAVESSSFFQQTVTVSLILVCVYLVYKIFQPKDTPLPPKPKIIQKPIEIREYTLDELSQYDGSDSNKPILIGINGKIFDVSRGAMFYGKGASYNVFAGRDATLGFAKNSTDPKDLEGPQDKLNWSEKDSLNDWYSRLSTKYEYVGTYKSPSEATVPKVETTTTTEIKTDIKKND